MSEGQERMRAQRRQFMLRGVVFVGLATVAEASGALPPGPNDVATYVASVVVFALCMGCAAVPWRRLPRWAIGIPISLYFVSVGLLLVSGGTNPSVQSTAGGLSVLVLLPVLVMALYYPRSYSVFAVVGALATLTAVGIAAHSSEATNLRRLLVWTAVAVAMSVTIHHLRDNLEGQIDESAELTRLGRIMNRATQSLNARRDPDEVIVEATGPMAQLGGPGVAGAAYVRLRPRAAVDEDGPVGDARAPHPDVGDDPGLLEALATGRPVVTTADAAASAPGRGREPGDGRRHTALIPVRVGGRLHGVFRVESEHAFSEDAVARCHALGNVVELALGNAIAHRELEVEANTDPLTGLANRRGLALHLAGDQSDRRRCILVMDIDGLKTVNDVHGHDVGDRVIVAVGRAASGVVADGGVLARTGGDEFVAVVAGIDETGARQMSDEVRRAVSQLAVLGVQPSVSIGWAPYSPSADIDEVIAQADRSMYTSKRARTRPRADRAPRAAERAPLAKT